MHREKKSRDQGIIKKIKKGEYQTDIARYYNITDAMVSKIKKKYLGVKAMRPYKIKNR